MQVPQTYKRRKEGIYKTFREMFDREIVKCGLTRMTGFFTDEEQKEYEDLLSKLKDEDWTNRHRP